MKKIFTKITTVVLTASVAMMMSGCFGSFALTSRLHNWNDDLSNSKFVKELVFLGLCILPVYELAVLGDALIFNTIEFWDGSNPIAMGATEVEESEFMHEGQKYQLVKKQNSLTVINGDMQVNFKYSPEDQSWYLMDGEEAVKVVELNDKSVITYLPNDKTLVFDQNSIDQVSAEVMAAR